MGQTGVFFLSFNSFKRLRLSHSRTLKLSTRSFRNFTSTHLTLVGQTPGAPIGRSGLGSPPRITTQQPVTLHSAWSHTTKYLNPSWLCDLHLRSARDRFLVMVLFPQGYFHCYAQMKNNCQDSGWTGAKIIKTKCINKHLTINQKCQIAKIVLASQMSECVR